MSETNTDKEQQQLLAGYSNRCKNVFNFDQVQITNPTKDEEEAPEQRRRRRRDHGQEDHRFYKAPKRSRSDDDDDPAGPESNTQDFKGRESLFRVPDQEEWKKKPGLDAAEFRKPQGFGRGRGRGRKMPDFAKNPEKYTKYSLEDVDLTNNQSNSRAAFAFLDDLKKRRTDGGDGEKFDVHKSDQKIVFKKPTKNRKDKDARGSSSLKTSTSTSETTSASEVSKTPNQKKVSSSGPTLSFAMEDEEEEED